MVVAVVATLVYLLTREGGLSATAWSSSSSASSIGGGAGLYCGPDREDDRDAAAGVAVQRGRRRRGGPRRDRRLHPAQLDGAPRRHDDLRRPRRGHRLGHVHRLADRRRQAPGPHPGQADLRARRPDRHDRPGGRRGPRHGRAHPRRGRDARPSTARRRSRSSGVVVAGRPDLRDHDGPADRRRGHAGRHQPAQLVHRHGRGDGRVRDREPGPDHRRRPRRCVRRDPDQAHGRRDEPLGHEHHGRRVRRRRRRGRGGGRCRRHGPRDRRRRRRDPARLRPARDHRARATASRSPRPSTRSASWPSSSSRAASTSSTPSTRSPAGCRGT